MNRTFFSVIKTGDCYTDILATKNIKFKKSVWQNVLNGGEVLSIHKFKKQKQNDVIWLQLGVFIGFILQLGVFIGFIGPLATAGRVLKHRVCPSVLSTSSIQFFLNFGTKLETHFTFCVAANFFFGLFVFKFAQKYKCAKNRGFMNLLKKKFLNLVDNEQFEPPSPPSFTKGRWGWGLPQIWQ